jgi:transposase
MNTKGHSRAVIAALLGALPGWDHRVAAPDDVLRILAYKGYVRSVEAPGNGRRWLLTPEGIAARTMFLDVKDRYERRQSGQAVALVYGVSNRTVLRWLDRMDVPARRNGTKLSDADRVRLAKAYRNGASFSQLAAEYAVSTFTVSNALRWAEEPIRAPGYPRPRYDARTGRLATAKA